MKSSQNDVLPNCLYLESTCFRFASVFEFQAIPNEMSGQRMLIMSEWTNVNGGVYHAAHNSCFHLKTSFVHYKNILIVHLSKIKILYTHDYAIPEGTLSSIQAKNVTINQNASMRRAILTNYRLFKNTFVCYQRSTMSQRAILQGHNRFNKWLMLMDTKKHAIACYLRLACYGSYTGVTEWYLSPIETCWGN